MEHHANLLPWRHRLECVVTGVGADGRVDLEAMERALADHRGAITLVAVSGASNVTGLVTPIHDVAELAHRHGARILVDAAQLAPHRRIDMRPADDPGHIDFLAFSAHKLYAPYGCGVLVGPRTFFTGMPEVLGGGAVDVVTPDDTVWAAMPDREEAGSPNVVGAVALAVAIDAVEAMGLDAVEDHEVGLARRVEAGLRGIPGARVLGPLGLSEEEVRLLRAAVIGGDRSRLPGAVRVSFAPYNTEAEAELVVRAVTSVATEAPRAEYVRDAHGDFLPAVGWPALPDLSAILPA
jgi:selenocysteine lyase/cysteine desulfurase